MNLPIYRAKKIDSEEYIEGYSINGRFIFKEWIDDVWTSYGETKSNKALVYEIDPTTLAIHFKDMLDSEGNKIFASLSDNGKGGDYTNCEELPVIFCWDFLNACVCLKGKYEYTALFKDGSTNSKNTTFNEYTIIGIQE